MFTLSVILWIAALFKLLCSYLHRQDGNDKACHRTFMQFILLMIAALLAGK